MRSQRLWFWLAGFLLLAIIGGGVWWFAGNTIATRAEINRLTTLLERDPQNYDAAFGLGVQYYRIRRYDQSARYYQTAVEIRPTYALAFNNLGNAYRESLRYQEAEAAYRQAIEIESDYISPYLNLANLLELWPPDEDGKDRQAEIPEVLTQGLAATDNNPTFLRALIDYYVTVGNEAKADTYRKMLEA